MSKNLKSINATRDRFMQWARNRSQQTVRGKSNPDPTSGGWEILGGVTNFIDANEIWKDRRQTELESIYAVCEVVYACVKKICVSAQEAVVKVGRERRRGWTDEPNHPLMGLFAQPNKEMSHSEFLWHYVAHLILTGKAYIWKWRNNAGYVAELWPVPTSWVTPIRDSSGIIGYEIFQGPNRAKIAVPWNDVICQIIPDPRNLSEGLGPLQAALRSVQTDEERQDYIVEMLTNNRSPGLIMKQPEGWTTEQKDEVRGIISNGLGRGRRGKPLFMEGEGATIEMMAPLKDLDWPGLSNLSETRICSAFGVPPIIIGLRVGLESGTYSNYDQALRSFYQGTMVPLWKSIDAVLTRGLLRNEGDSDETREIYHDTADIRALREDEDKQAERAAKLYAASLATKNEARELAGLDPLPPEQGDVFLMPFASTEVPATGARPQLEAPPKDDGTITEQQ